MALNIRTAGHQATTAASPIGAPVPLRAQEPVNYAVPALTGGFDAPVTPTVGSLLAAVAIRRGQPAGPASDSELEEFLYDCLEFLPGTSDVDIRCESGRVTFGGTVTHKRQKRDVGENRLVHSDSHRRSEQRDDCGPAPGAGSGPRGRVPHGRAGAQVGLNGRRERTGHATPGRVALVLSLLRRGRGCDGSVQLEKMTRIRVFPGPVVPAVALRASARQALSHPSYLGSTAAASSI